MMAVCRFLLLIVITVHAGCATDVIEQEHEKTAIKSIQAKSALIEELGADAAAILVTWNESALVVSGFVESETQMQQALDVLRQLNEKIVNRLKVFSVE